MWELYQNVYPHMYKYSSVNSFPSFVVSFRVSFWTILKICLQIDKTFYKKETCAAFILLCLDPQWADIVLSPVFYCVLAWSSTKILCTKKPAGYSHFRDQWSICALHGGAQTLRHAAVTWWLQSALGLWGVVGLLVHVDAVHVYLVFLVCSDKVNKSYGAQCLFSKTPNAKYPYVAYRTPWEVRTRHVGVMTKSFEQCEKVPFYFTTTELWTVWKLSQWDKFKHSSSCSTRHVLPRAGPSTLLRPHNSSGDFCDFWHLFVAVSEWFNILRCPDLFQHNTDFISQMSSHHPRLSRGARRAFRADRKPCYYCVIQPSHPADDSMCAYKRAARGLILGTFFHPHSQIPFSLSSCRTIKLKQGQVQTDRDQQ